MTEGVTKTKYLSVDELETGSHQGIKVAWVGEEGDALAIVGDRAAGEAAILGMARNDLGGACVPVGEVQQVWMRFHIPEGHHSDEWQGERCQEADAGAIRVVWAEGVSSQRELMLAERSRLMREHPEIKWARDLAPLMGEHEGEYWRWQAGMPS